MKERRAKGGRMIRRRRKDERAIELKDEGRKDGGREDEGQNMKDEERRK